MTRLSHPLRRRREEDVPSPASATIFDRQLLSEVQATIGPARLHQLLELLAVELIAKPRSIREALADCDFHRAAYEAHSLKGAAACLGAKAVASAARDIEQALGKGSPRRPRRVADAMRRMAGAVGETQSALSNLPRAASSPAPFA